LNLSMHIVFETDRLIFRQFSPADAPLILKLNSDPEIVKYVHEPVLTSEAAAKKIILDIIMPQYRHDLGRWALHTRSDMNFIGWCGLKLRPERNEIDLGYRLCKSEWGNGYATEAAEKTLQYGFNEQHLKLITGRAHIENKASIKVLEKIGMQFIAEEIVDDCPVRTYNLANPNL
jgi:[ribosomal protein S5]-alanine N-acetyltransferase